MKDELRDKLKNVPVGGTFFYGGNEYIRISAFKNARFLPVLIVGRPTASLTTFYKELIVRIPPK